MKFGLLFELGGPPNSSREDVKKIYDNALDQITLADELGFDHTWAVEHHFSPPHSYSTAPEIFLTAAAMRTKRIRIGHGIVVCVPPMNHPAHIAERSAVLDIVSNGRLDVGTGRSNTWLEIGGYAGEPHDTKQSWDEYVRALPKMWTEPTYSNPNGRFFKMPERAVVPEPLQNPHPPLWLAVTSPGTEYEAADRGLGVFGLSIGNYKAQEEKIANYRRRIQNCDPISSVVNEQVHVVNFMHCGLDESASERGRLMLDTFNHNTAHTVPVKEVYPSPLYNIGGFLPTLRQEALGPGDATGIPEGLAIGTPDRIIDVVKHWQSIGVDGMNFVIQASEVLKHEEVMQSLRDFATYVMPQFKTPEELAAPVPTGMRRV